MAVNSDVLPHRREVFNMIRTILGVIFTALFLILTLPVFAVQALLRKIWPHLGERSSFAIVQTAFRILQLPLGVHNVLLPAIWMSSLSIRSFRPSQDLWPSMILKKSRSCPCGCAGSTANSW